MSLLGLPPLRPNFEAAVRDVGAKNPALRVQAAERLGDSSEEERPRALVALRAMLADRDARVRCAALDAAGHLQDAELLAPVIDLLEDTDASVRELSVVALSRIGGDVAARAVRRALRSDHAETRFQAVQSHIELCPDDADALRPLVRDEDPMVRANVAQALGESSAPDAVTLLAACLEDHNPKVRRRAAIELARRGDARGFKDSVAALGDTELVFDALDALGELGDPAAVDSIAQQALGLFTPLALKACVGGALHRLGDARGVELLRQVLTAWRADGRSLAVEIIGQQRVSELAPELSRLIDKPRRVDTATLARAISQLFPTVPTLQPALEKLRLHGGEAAQIAQAALETPPM